MTKSSRGHRIATSLSGEQMLLSDIVSTCLPKLANIPSSVGIGACHFELTIPIHSCLFLISAIAFYFVQLNKKHCECKLRAQQASQTRMCCVRNLVKVLLSSTFDVKAVCTLFEMSRSSSLPICIRTTQPEGDPQAVCSGKATSIIISLISLQVNPFVSNKTFSMLF